MGLHAGMDQWIRLLLLDSTTDCLGPLPSLSLVAVILHELDPPNRCNRKYRACVSSRICGRLHRDYCIALSSLCAGGLGSDLRRAGTIFYPTWCCHFFYSGKLSMEKDISCSFSQLDHRCISAVALSLNLLGLFFSFHVPCGSTFYQTGLCYRPLFKDFPSEVHASEASFGWTCH